MKTLRVMTIAMLLTARLSAAEPLQEVTVGAGDTMWSIANKYLKDPQKWPEIVKYNNLPTSDPTIALPGTRIKIPVLLIKEEFRNAELVSIVKEVRYKRKTEADWKEAKANMTLKYEDSLRTLNGSQARVKFPSKEIIQINENSYVVLKPEKILQEIQLIKGDVRASRAKVIMPGGTVVKPQKPNSDYQAKVREDESEVVFVYKGEVDVTAQGKTVTVKEGFGTHVPKSAPPSLPQPLSNFKDFNPAEMNTPIPDGAGTVSARVPSGGVKIVPPTTASKEKASSGQKAKSLMSERILVNYRLQVSKDEKFSTIVLEKNEPIGKEFDIKKENVPDGTYFMRVAFTDTTGEVGPFAHPSMVIRDTLPPEITNLIPLEGAQFSGEEAYCDLVGVVKGASLVAVNNEVVFVSAAGRFEKFVNLKEGANIISVIARDTQGNQTLIERKVYYRK